MNPWLQFALAIEPGAERLVMGFIDLLKKHPALTADQLAAALATTAKAVQALDADTQQTVQQDQAVHP